MGNETEDVEGRETVEKRNSLDILLTHSDNGVTDRKKRDDGESGRRKKWEK